MQFFENVFVQEIIIAYRSHEVGDIATVITKFESHVQTFIPRIANFHRLKIIQQLDQHYDLFIRLNCIYISSQLHYFVNSDFDVDPLTTQRSPTRKNTRSVWLAENSIPVGKPEFALMYENDNVLEFSASWKRLIGISSEIISFIEPTANQMAAPELPVNTNRNKISGWEIGSSKISNKSNSRRRPNNPGINYKL